MYDTTNECFVWGVTGMGKITCTFFGHRDCPADVEGALCQAIESLILQYNVTQFYVGNHGKFDAMVRRVLKISLLPTKAEAPKSFLSLYSFAIPFKASI